MSDTDTIDGLIRNPVDYDTVGRWPPDDHDPDRGPARYTRRLSDKILIAFHHACDDRDIEVAGRLLGVLEFMITRAPVLPAGRDRRSKESLVAAYERLWALRHPGLSSADLGR
jgi:hypothetical protein